MHAHVLCLYANSTLIFTGGENKSQNLKDIANAAIKPGCIRLKAYQKHLPFFGILYDFYNQEELQMIYGKAGLRVHWLKKEMIV